MFVAAPEAMGVCETLFAHVIEAFRRDEARVLDVQFVVDGLVVHSDISLPGPDIVAAFSGEMGDYPLPTLPPLMFLSTRWEAVVNALAESLEIRLSDGDTVVIWSFHRGIPAAGSPTTRAATRDVGITYTFHPDPEVMTDPRLDAVAIRARLVELAHLYPGLDVRVSEERFLTSMGLPSYAKLLAGGLVASQHITGEYDGFDVDAVLFSGPISRAWYEGTRVFAGTHCQGLSEALDAAGLNCGTLLHLTGRTIHLDESGRCTQGQELRRAVRTVLGDGISRLSAPELEHLRTASQDCAS